METRECSRCGNPYPRTPEFWPKKKTSADGLAYHCKGCRKKYDQIRYDKNSEQHKARAKKWREDHPDQLKESKKRYSEENKNRIREVSHEWYIKNREREIERSRKWRENHPEYSAEYYQENSEKVKARGNKWAKENRPKRNATGQKRRAYKKGAEGYYTPEQIDALYDFQEGRCFHCDCDISDYFERDHWIPLTKGGSNWPENIRLLCRHCNRSKHHKLPHEWHPETYPPST